MFGIGPQYHQNIEGSLSFFQDMPTLSSAIITFSHLFNVHLLVLQRSMLRILNAFNEERDVRQQDFMKIDPFALQRTFTGNFN